MQLVTSDKKHFIASSKQNESQCDDAQYVDQQKGIIEENLMKAETMEVVSNRFKKIHMKSRIGGLSEEVEKRIIVNTVGPWKGHWFKCTNGHVYAIGEWRSDRTRKVSRMQEMLCTIMA